MSELDIAPPAGRKGCIHGSWFNNSPSQEDMPEMLFKCGLTGFIGDLAKPKYEGLCNKCIFYKEKRNA